MTKQITIGIKHPGCPWHFAEVEDALPTYQRIVGGYIEHFETTVSGVEFFCNEEGKLLRLPLNMTSTSGDLIRGTVFAVRSNEEGEFTGLTGEDIYDLSRL